MRNCEGNLSIAQESLKGVDDSLAESNGQAEELRRKYSDLQLRMEALGLASANKDRSKTGAAVCWRR